jgi:hypothetical protein
VTFDAPAQLPVRVFNANGRVRVVTGEAEGWNQSVQRFGTVRPDALFDDDFE